MLVAAAVFAPAIAPADPYAIGSGQPFSPPSREHPMGTDDLGRDVLSRVLFGARVSLRVAILSVTAAIAVAVPLGLAAGYMGGLVDGAISRLFDTIFAFPAILIGIGFVAVLGPDLQNVIIAVAIINIPTIGRLVRTSVLGQRDQDYVEAIRAMGASNPRIALRHILPNVLPPLFVQAALAAGEAVLLEAAFSFLGLGSRPPTPSWGAMLNEGRRFLDRAPWLGIFPGLAITLMIFGLNSLGDGVRTALDPRRWRQTANRTETKGA
jgi:peptide/nickel transport system permease protein